MNNYSIDLFKESLKNIFASDVNEEGENIILKIPEFIDDEENEKEENKDKIKELINNLNNKIIDEWWVIDEKKCEIPVYYIFPFSIKRTKQVTKNPYIYQDKKYKVELIKRITDEQAIFIIIELNRKYNINFKDYSKDYFYQHHHHDKLLISCLKNIFSDIFMLKITKMGDGSINWESDKTIYENILTTYLFNFSKVNIFPIWSFSQKGVINQVFKGLYKENENYENYDVFNYDKELVYRFIIGSNSLDNLTSWLSYYHVIEYLYEDVLKIAIKEISEGTIKKSLERDIKNLAAEESVIMKTFEIFLKKKDIEEIKKTLTNLKDEKLKYYDFSDGKNSTKIAKKIYDIRNQLVHNKPNNKKRKSSFELERSDILIMKTIAQKIITNYTKSYKEE